MVGQKVGSITDLVVNTREIPWTVKKIAFKKRTLKGKTLALVINRVKKVDKTQKVIIVNYGETEPSPKLSKIEMMLLNDLTKKNAISEDHEDIGKIYDFDVSTLTNPWTVEKVLLKPGIKKRRLRISVDRVKLLGKNVVIEPR